MADFKIWCISFCALLVITAVIRFLVPDGNMKKSMDTVLSLIVILFMLLPFTNRNSSNNLRLFELEEITQNFNESTQYEDALKKYIADIFERQGIEYKEITVSAFVDAEGYINIEEINIQISDINQVDNVKEMLEKNCEFDSKTVRINVDD